ncbi:MAG: hypothetical protein HYW85_00890 [Deltaproteobacteria bacterium]|nr:hypothetical protein [Deltaproteobacteria bacterium]
MFPRSLNLKVVSYALFSLMILMMGALQAKEIQRKVVILKPDYQAKFVILNQEQLENGVGRQAHLKVELYAKQAEPVPTGWIYSPVPTGWGYGPIPTGWRSQPVPTGWIYQPIPTGWRSEPIPSGWRYEVEWEFVNQKKVSEVPLKRVASEPLNTKAVLVSDKTFSFLQSDTYLLKLRFYLRTGAKHRFLAHEVQEKVVIAK